MESSTFEIDALVSSLPPEGNHTPSDDGGGGGGGGDAEAVPDHEAHGPRLRASPPRARKSPRSSRRRHDPPGSIDNHQSFVLAGEYNSFEGGYDDDCVDEDQDDSDRSTEQEGVLGADGFLETNAEGRGNEDQASRGRSDDQNVAGSCSASSRRAVSAASRAPPRRRPAEATREESDPLLALLDARGVTGGPRSELAMGTGASERKVWRVARVTSMKSEGGPRTPPQRSLRVASRSVARSKSFDEGIISLQMAVKATSGLRRTPTPKCRTVGRCQFDTTGCSPPIIPRTDLSTLLSNPFTDSSPPGIEDSALCSVATNVTCERASRDTLPQASKGDISASPQDAKVLQRNAKLSQSSHTSRRPPSLGHSAFHRRPNRSNTSSRRIMRSRSSDPVSRSSRGDETVEVNNSLDSRTFHVSRVIKDRKKGSKDRAISSPLHLHIENPSNFDLGSFPALSVTDAEIDASNGGFAEASSTKFSSLLQLDIDDPSIVSTCAFPSVIGEAASSPSFREACLDEASRGASTGAQLRPSVPQPVKDAPSRLLFKMQSHLLRHAVFTSQT